MPKEIKGIIVSRLIILLSIILVPIAIFLIFSLTSFNLWYSNDVELEFWIIRILCPSVFSISWLFFLLLFAGRFSNTIDDFDHKISVVPSRLKFFYGINAIYILFIFVFPFITPIVSILSFASFAWRLTTFKKDNWESDSKVSALTKIIMVVASILPIFCTISIVPHFFALSSFLWEDIWIPILPYLFIISYSLFTALAFGSLIILFYNSGISEYEQIFIEPSQKQILWYIKFLELILFVFFFLLDYFEFDVIDFFYIAGFIAIIFTSIVNFFRGKSKYKGFKSHFFGYLIAAVFISSNVIFTAEISEIVGIVSLIISAMLYIFVLFYTFLTIE